jgi:hypothetical protein
LIAQDKVLTCDSTGIRGQMGLHRTKRTYRIYQTKRTDDSRQDQQDRVIKSKDQSMQAQEEQIGLYCTGQDDRGDYTRL